MPREDEPSSEFLRVFDPLTGGIIICVNELALRDGSSKTFNQWSEWCQTHGFTQTPQICVYTEEPYDSKAFTHDAHVDQAKIPQFVDMLIDYACMMDKYLREYNKSVIVHCKNGRSRSPTVILAFMMLRGIKLDHAKEWLTLAFQSQRPTIHEKSANLHVVC